METEASSRLSEERSVRRTQDVDSLRSYFHRISLTILLSFSVTSGSVIIIITTSKLYPACTGGIMTLISGMKIILTNKLLFPRNLGHSPPYAYATGGNERSEAPRSEENDRPSLAAT